MTRRGKSPFRRYIACCAFTLLVFLSSCGRDTPTTAVNQAPPDGVTIHPNGPTDFFIGSTAIGDATDRQIDVWGQDLRVVDQTHVVFDVVLINTSKEPVYPLVFFYVTKTVPSVVRVANYDSHGFGDSFVFDFSNNLGNDERLDPGERSTGRAMDFDMPEIMSFAIGFRVAVGTPPVGVNCPAPYPTSIPALAPEELETLLAEFKALNPNICSDLNPYGFTQGFCSPLPKQLPEDADIERLIADAKMTLAENFRFTGVADSSSLVVKSHIFFRGELHVYFGRQVYDRLEVVHSDIRVDVDAAGVRSIHGNHYPEICVPSQPVLPPIPAQESIIGLRIQWYDLRGDRRVKVVTEDDLSEAPTKVVLPVTRDGSIQLRVAWRIPVGMDNMRAWYVYVDTMDRELLWIEQLFYT